MKKIIILAVVTALVSLSCYPYPPPSPAAHQGGVTGGVVGGVAGALLDRRNPWRGGIIGGVLGAVMGATLGDIADRAGREAAYSERPVEYRTDDGRGLYRADPMGYDARTNCRKVRERVWEEGKLIKDQVKEICEGTKTEPGY